MDSRQNIFVCLALHFCLPSAKAWSGHYCTSTYQTAATRSVCDNSWCWAHRTELYSIYHLSHACCSGWTTQPGTENCVIPICSPPCQNGGTCYEPNRCRCRTENKGPLCDGTVCSHLSPCYPGTCLPNSQCTCHTGFETVSGQQNYCLKIQSSLYKDLRIYDVRARMSTLKTYETPAVEKYYLIAETTDYANDSRIVWTRFRDFNRLEVNCTSQFLLPDIPPTPEYIFRSGFGITEGVVELSQSKLNAQGNRTETNVGTLNCLHTVTPTSPEPGIYNCKTGTQVINYNLEPGDHFRLTFKTAGGGFRELYDLNPPHPVLYRTQTYQGIERALSVEFRFDTLSPTHCQEDSSCKAQETMLRVEDITKFPLTIFWNGWKDADSGMHRYAVDIYKLTQTVNKSLEVRREDVSTPVYRKEILNADVAPFHFTPSEPGMYAIVLEVADEALNAKYVRRLCLYDPSSTITTDVNNALFVSTASKVSDYAYQSDVNGSIVVTWDMHFRNELHDSHDFLGRVLNFPDILGDFPKVIPPELDDNEGQRTTKAIPNKKGIVNFEVAYAIDQMGGNSHSDLPVSAWGKVYLNTTFTLPLTPRESSTVTIWVKATDAMNNTKVERTKVTMDSTQPVIHRLEFQMNAYVPGIDFSSTFSLLAEDKESGIAYILWTFRRSNQSVVFQDRQNITQIPSCNDPSGSCYCTSTLECYLVDQSYSLSNCHMIVEKENLATENILVLVEVINKAGRSTTKTITGIDLTSLNGTKAYFPPQNLNVKYATDTSVTLTWDFPPSCIERTEVWVIVNNERRPVHKDAQQFDITGLSPATSYTIHMQTVYAGGEISDSQPFTTTTMEAPSNVGAIVGGVIGSIIIILLILLVLIFVSWRKGYILQKPGRINKQLNRMNTVYNNFSSRVSRKYTQGAQRNRGKANRNSNDFSNVAYAVDGDTNDEIYVYGAMTFDSRQKWHLDDRNLTLLNQIAEGKFAVVYKANWRASGGVGETVAVKMLKSGYTKDDELKMTAKINFFATQLEDHENILKFIGAVMENTSWGPVMVMEYCQVGQLDKWLLSKKDCVDEQVIENLYQFARGIANGMAYLAAKKVLHKRLAARNILLTSLLEVRVAGFGPQTKETEQEKATRVPAKWAAPEVLEDKSATEKSDVWSFGIVLWEMFSLGSVPYPDIPSRELGTRLKDGYRLDKPEIVDNIWHQMMKDCWEFSPRKRPTFASVRDKIDSLFSSNRASSGFYYDSNELKS